MAASRSVRILWPISTPVAGSIHREKSSGKIVATSAAVPTDEEIDRLATDIINLHLKKRWPATFGMAKAFHRLGDKPRAFELMLKAHHGNPSLSGFAREAGLVAFQIGRFREGVELTQAAITTRPGDGSLYSNLGLGSLLGGDAAAAVEAFQRATELEPGHSLTPRLLAVAQAVQSGALPFPTSEADVLRAVQQFVGRERGGQRESFQARK